MIFYTQVFKTLIESLGNDYHDNWDYVRFGAEPPVKQNKLKRYLKTRLNQQGLLKSKDLTNLISRSEKHIRHFDYLFNQLEDELSKELLIKIFAFRLLGYKKVKLPLNTRTYWSDLARVEALAKKDDVIDPNFGNFILHRFDLRTLNYPIEIYFTALGILIDFVVKQYEFKRNGVSICADPGDVVLDGGGCWGDTALFFSNAVGPAGKVFSFEFIPFNADLFNKNVGLNPALKGAVELVQRPLWESSGVNLYMKENGPASSVSLQPYPEKTGIVSTLSIDDFVEQKNLSRVDLIKLDIEGAEMMALKGATKTIKKFRPKLALALYHYESDFENIPKFLKDLDLGYKFHISHCTIHSEETILFATAR